MNDHDQPAMVLTMADYYGTLAAARCLGERGVPVWVAGSRFFSPALWSRWATRRFLGPSATDANALVDWLLDLGRREPGHVLYPTSDDLLWSFAKREDEIRSVFRTYMPNRDAIVALLDKSILYRSWSEMGQSTPRTWFPRTESDLAAIAREARFPLVIKPRSQAAFPSHVKGVYVASADALVPRHREFTTRFRHEEAIARSMPDVDLPMIQEYHSEAADSIYSLSGFVDRTGELCVMRGARKVLQRPRRLGLGICFEDVPVDPDLAEAMRVLLRKHGYYGIFEAELIAVGDEHLLIDLNPRFFGQMQFDIARGCPLPLFAYLGACGRERDLLSAVNEAHFSFFDRGSGHCHSIALSILVGLQRISGRMTEEEATRWRSFMDRESISDMVRDHRDPLPAWIDALTHVGGMFRHPRWATRSLLLDSA